MPVETEDEFQKELVELFVQEAHEWLQQIHIALDELQQSPDSDRHRVLAQTIKVGITNLGGSAATVNLTDVERASFSALPFVEALQDPSAHVPADNFLGLCKQLGDIHGALTRATGVTFEAESPQTAEHGSPATIPTKELLTRLHGIQTNSGPSQTIPRNLVQIIVAQAEALIQRGTGQYPIASIQEFLDRSAEGDQGFLTLVHQHASHLTGVLRALTSSDAAAGASSTDLPTAVERVAQLWSAAQQVNASQAMTFFMGLHSFLTIVSQQRVVVKARSIVAVQVRLAQCVNAIEGWVESGRVERLAIQGVLSH
jgi:chemotaxis protein histidine kinase CheA